MEKRRIFIEIRGGCFQAASGVPDSCAIEVIDWDNLLDDTGGTARDWNRLHARAQEFIRQRYPDDYRRIHEKLAPSYGK